MIRIIAFIFVLIFPALVYVLFNASAVDETRQIISAQEIAPEKIFNAETFTLKNGMDIVVIPNHRAPVITHMVWYRAGAADEPSGKSGIAHFLEHLLFKGSDGLAPGEFSKTIRKLGGNDNAFTSQDYTAYYQSIALKHLETVMRMEAGRMRRLAPPLEEVLSERKVILEERRMRVENNPRAKFSEQLNAALYVNHPYANPVIGWAHEIESLSWEDAKQFYDHWYAPNNAILVVSGDVTGAQVYELAKEIYGPLKPSTKPFIRDRDISPPFDGQSTLTMRREDIRQPTVQHSYRVPSARQNKQDSLALEILEDILSNGPTSRFYKSLVIEQKIASSAGMVYRSDTWDDGSVVLYANPTPDQNPKDVKNSLIAELRKVIEHGITEQELATSKTRMKDAAIYARDSLSGPAMILGRALVTGSSIDDVEYWPSDIEKVTASQIQDVATRYLNPDAPYKIPPVTGYLLPAKTTAEGEKQ